MQFEGFPKLSRLYRQMTVTEKLDGTNAAVVIGEDGEFACQSRKRIITPEDDNYTFARWAYEVKDSLIEILGPGRHFGEWWGQGIQRRYDMPIKKFSLFNVARWPGLVADRAGWPEQLDVVPVIYTGVFSTEKITEIKDSLKEHGSVASPGFMNPEGVVVWHEAARTMFKSTLDEYDVSGGKTWDAK